MAVKKIPEKKSQRREAARQSLREEILAASRDIITQEGFAALTMRKLAERIGYSPATLYLHFRNRDEIAHAVSRTGYADLLKTLSSITEKDRGKPADRLRSLAKAYVQFGLENPQTYALIFMEDPAYLAAVFAEPAEDDPAAACYNLMLAATGDLLAAGMRPPKAGKPARAVTAVELTESLWASMHGIVSLKLTCPAFPTAPADLLTEVLIETMLRGLSAATAKK
ncbi:MAG TPA: TetR/AcrR family transcriptional regulator [Edaphobacter sp.]